MQITFSGRHVHLSQEQQDWIKGKLSKISQFFDKIRVVDVVVSKEGPNFAVEVIVKPDHHDRIVSRDVGTDIQACVDVILDKLERQITKYKEKVRNRKHQGGQTEA